MTDIVIKTQAVGQRRASMQDWRVALPARTSWSLRESLRHLVEAEVAAFRERQQVSFVGGETS